MRLHRILLIMLFVTGLILIAPNVRHAEATYPLPGWHWETIASGVYSSIAVDNARNLHLAFSNFDLINLNYAVRGPDGWDITTVDFTQYSGFYPSLALDSAGNPHISSVTGNARLYYSYRDMDGWHSEEVSDSVYFDKVQIAIDHSGLVHLAFWKYPQVVYATRIDGIWQTQVVYDCPTGPYMFCSRIDLALNTDDNPVIAFFQQEGSVLTIKVATWNGSEWQIEQAGPDLDAFYVQQLSLAVDGSNQPHLSFSTDRALMYAHRDASGWTVETVAKDAISNDIAVSINGIPHLAFFSINYPSLKYYTALNYAYRDTAGWHHQILDDIGFTGELPSITLIDGYPSISYAYRDYEENMGLRMVSLTPIDINPGEYPNLIDLSSNRKILVLVLSTGGLDARTIDPSTITFGPAGAHPANGQYILKDADMDGDIDLGIAFRLVETGIPCGATSVTLQAQTYDHQPFNGWDEIKTIGCGE